jgi:hypothetical protein
MAGERYNRTKKCFRLIKKRNRETVPPEVYATKECCNPMRVLAKVGDNTSWKNDITSAWFKTTGDLQDSVDFILYKKGDVLASYQPSEVDFTLDIAVATTINWQDVLALDGVGCYYLKVDYVLDGQSGSLIWGEYDLREYSIENAKGTIRTKVNLNQYYSIEDINFKGMNLVDCLRINGYFGDMLPNFKIDNLIYENRKFESVQRERIATYTLKTDPIMYNISDLLINVHLLAENEIWISDYNSFNHSWFLKDKELIVNNSPEVDYMEFSRLASIKCEFTDKTRNSLAKYV